MPSMEDTVHIVHRKCDELDRNIRWGNARLLVSSCATMRRADILRSKRRKRRLWEKALYNVVAEWDANAW